MKLLKKLVLILVILLVALIAFVRYFGGVAIKKAVNTAGPLVLGVPVELNTAQIRPLAGHVHLGGLKVGNPDGFKTDHLFELGHLEIDLVPRSLFGDTIHIKTIDIKAPKITMERGLTTSNLGALLEKLEKKGGDTTDDPAAEKKPAQGGKKVVIDSITINGAQLNLSVTAMGGFSAPLPLPPISLSDIGKEKQGASLLEVLTRILRAILTSATDVVAGAGKLVGEGAAAVGGLAVDGAAVVGGAAVDGAAAVGGVAVDGAKAVGGTAAAVGGAAVDGAAAVGGVAVDGAKAVGGAAAAAGGAVVDGAGKALKGVGGLIGLGGGEKEKKEE